MNGLTYSLNLHLLPTEICLALLTLGVLVVLMLPLRNKNKIVTLVAGWGLALLLLPWYLSRNLNGISCSGLVAVDPAASWVTRVGISLLSNRPAMITAFPVPKTDATLTHLIGSSCPPVVSPAAVALSS